MKQLKLVVAIFLSGSLLVLCANLFLPRALPESPTERLQVYLRAGMHAEADLIYEGLMREQPLNSDFHSAYIQNHFKIASSLREDDQILQTFTALTKQTESADLGWLGLGMVYVHQEAYPQAITALDHIKNNDQKYVNLVLGQAYAGLKRTPQAEAHFRHEISNAGAVSQAVTLLASLYLEQGMSTELHRLLSDQQLAPFVGLSAQRRLAFEAADWSQYLSLTYLRPFSAFSSLALGFASLICLAWLVYFGVLNHLNGRSPYPLFLLTGMGALAAPLTFILTDVLNFVWPKLSSPGRVWEFARYVIQIGLVEEMVKFLPVLLVAGGPAFFRKLFRLPAPAKRLDAFTLLMAGSLSALGFATLENAGYFSRYGLDVVYPRFWYSTVMHMANTAWIGYAWVWARDLRPGRQWVALGFGLVLAALIHGIYDFFLLNSEGTRLILVSLILMLVMVREFHRYLQNALNYSPATAGITTPVHVNLFAWLAGISLAILALLYLHSYQTLATEIANARLSSLSLSALPPALVVLAALGRLRLQSGDLKPWGLRRNPDQPAGNGIVSWLGCVRPSSVWSGVESGNFPLRFNLDGDLKWLQSRIPRSFKKISGSK